MKNARPCILFGAILSLMALTAAADKEQGAGTQRSVGLALGSGGASGLAHIAMLQVFDELGIQPDRISGTSIGAVIGMLYAGGLDADAIRDVFSDFDGSGLDVLRALAVKDTDLSLADVWDMDMNNGGLLNADGFIDFLADKVGVTDFDELRIPLDVVATDFWSGETVVLSEGNLLQAVKAGIAVPGLFSPVRINDQLLIDGGTSNPLPYNLLTGRYDLVVAIDVTGTRPPDEADVNWINMLFKTFEVMQQSLINAHMRESEPDIYIRLDIVDVRLLEFNRLSYILKQAESAAKDLKQQLVERQP